MDWYSDYVQGHNLSIVLFGDGWGLLRASNTQPVLVMRFEAQTPGRLQEIQEIVIGKLQEVAPEIQIPLEG